MDLYKRRTAVEIEQQVSHLETISADLIAYLDSSPRTRFVEVLYYGHVPASHRQSVKRSLACRLAPRAQSISVDVFPGEEWNHSRYQAAVEREDTVHVVLVLQKYCSWVEGVSKGSVYGNARTLRAIARATYEILLPKALYFRIGEDLMDDEVL